MDLKIDEAAVRDVVAHAIMEQIGAEGREKLIEAALQALLEPPKDRYGSYGYTPLQAAFNNAVQSVAAQVVREQVADDPVFIARVKEKVGEALIKMDDENYTNYVADALAQALKAKTS
jgi:hypothetical protein